MNKFIGLSKALFVNDVKGRMLRGTLANLYDKGAVMLVQLLTIPVLTQSWGVDGYGLWLLLMTLPTYIALSDMGVATAAGVMLTTTISKGNYVKALSILQSTVAIVMGTVVIACLGVVCYLAWYWYNGKQIANFSSEQVVIAALLLVGYSLIFTQMNIITVVWRATHKYAFAMTYAGTFILIEGLVLISIAINKGGIVETACAFFLIRLIGYLVFLILLKKRENWVSISFSNVDKSQIKELFSPSIAALALVLALAISIQGSTLLVGFMAGATAVGIYGATRTLVRAPLQLSGLVIRPSIPELTRAYTEKNFTIINKLNKLNLKATLYSLLPISVIFLIFGKKIIFFISNGKIIAPYWLIVFLLLSIIFYGIWSCFSTILVSINKQKYFSYHYLFFVVASIALIYIFDFKNLEEIAFFMIFPEFIMIFLVYFKLKKINLVG